LKFEKSKYNHKVRRLRIKCCLFSTEEVTNEILLNMHVGETLNVLLYIDKKEFN